MIPSAMGAPGLTEPMLYGIAVRHADHAAGRGARLLAAVAGAGISWTVVRVWPGTTEKHEKALKDLNNRRLLCPSCTPGSRSGTVIVPKPYRRAYAPVR